MAIRDRAPADRLSVLYSPCGRCGGSGKVPFYNEATGEPDETFCGICSGTGQSTMRFDTVGAQQVTFGTRHYADGVAVVKAAGRSRKG